MTRPDGAADPFGSLSNLPDGIDLPEITPGLWDKRENVAATLPWVLALVRASGLPEWWEAAIAEEKKRANPDSRAGRPRDVTVEAVLVGWLMCKSTRRSLLDSEIARFLLHTISDAQREALGVPLVQGDPTQSRDAIERGRLDKKAVAARIARLARQMFDLINPSEYDQPRNRKKIDKDLLRRDVTREQLADAQQRLDWVVSQMTTAPLKAMPRWLRRQWTGDAAVDGTHVRLPSRGDTKRSNAWDIDGGVYKRVKATSDKNAPKNKGGKGAKAIQTKYDFALDLALVVACDATPATGSTSRACRSDSPPTSQAPRTSPTPAACSTSWPPPASASGTWPPTGSTPTRAAATGTATSPSTAGAPSTTTASTISAGRASPRAARCSSKVRSAAR